MRVSVVVPCFDVEPYVESCLRSLAVQTHPDLEVVVVDDGSTDGTHAAIERCIAGDPRFRLVHQSNRGLGAARNAGVDRSSGDGLVFVDGDDFLAPEAVERMVDAASSSSSELVVGAIHVWRRGETWRASQHRAVYDTDRRSLELRDRPDLVYDTMACSKLFCRSLWDRLDLRFREGVRFEDADLVMQALTGARGIDVVSSPVYFWRRREDGDAPSLTQIVDGVAHRDRFAALFLAHRHVLAGAEREVVSEHVRKLVEVDVRGAMRRAAPGGEGAMGVVASSARPLVGLFDEPAMRSLSPMMQLVCRQIVNDDVRGMLLSERVFGGGGRSTTTRSVAALRLVAARPGSVRQIVRARLRRRADHSVPRRRSAPPSTTMS